MIVALLVFVAAVLAYALFGRKWLKRQTWTVRFFTWVEPVEIALWRKSETILWARVRMLLGILLPVLSYVGAFDPTPYLAVIPDHWEPWMFVIIAASGLIAELLRRATTKPLELVELPEDVSPKVAAAVQAAEVSKDRAVAVVEASERP